MQAYGVDRAVYFAPVPTTDWPNDTQTVVANVPGMGPAGGGVDELPERLLLGEAEEQIVRADPATKKVRGKRKVVEVDPQLVRERLRKSSRLAPPGSLVISRRHRLQVSSSDKDQETEEQFLELSSNPNSYQFKRP